MSGMITQKYVPVGKANTAVVLESTFDEKVNVLMESLWNFATPEHEVAQMVKETLAARQKLRVTHGYPAEKPLIAAISRGPGQAAAPRDNWQEGNWKGHLDTAYCRAQRHNSNFVYETSGEEGAFVSQVSSPDFAAVYVGDQAEGKKRAEHNAAQKAMASEYPAEYGALMSQNGGPHADTPRTAAGQQKKKRVRPATSGVISAEGVAQQSEPKYKLQEAAQLLLGRSLVKGDVVFECHAVDGSPLTMATVTIPHLDGARVFFGEPAETKKLAENAACQALLHSDLAPEIARLDVEHQAKKAEKLQAREEEYQIKKARKREADPLTPALRFTPPGL